MLDSLSSDLIISSDDSDDDKVSGVPNACLYNVTFLASSKSTYFLSNSDAFRDFRLHTVGKTVYLASTDAFCRQVSKPCETPERKRVGVTMCV